MPTSRRAHWVAAGHHGDTLLHENRLVSARTGDRRLAEPGTPFATSTCSDMRIALIAPPFIPVPPKGYGGTELFIAQLGEGLVARGHEVTVFANGASTVRSTLRWTFPEADWPPQPGGGAMLKNLDHSAWAMSVARDEDFDLVHVNDALAVPMSRFLSKPVVHTLHHPHDQELSALYARHPCVQLRDDQRGTARAGIDAAPPDDSPRDPAGGLSVLRAEAAVSRLPRPDGAGQGTTPGNRSRPPGRSSAQAGGRDSADLPGLLAHDGRTAH